MNPRVALFPGTRLSDPTYSRVLTNLARALNERGWIARAFCPESDSFSDLRAFKPSVLNLHCSGTVSPRAASWARNLSTPLALTFQDLDHPDMAAPSPAARKRIVSLARAARRVTALTPILAKAVRRRFGRSPRVLGNAVYGGLLAKTARPRGGPIVAVARLSPYKGIDVLLWAFADLARREPRAKLVVYGADFQRGHYQRLAARLGLKDRVRFAGQTSPRVLARALEGAVFFVSASRRETYGMAVLEAMAAGAPVVATRTGAAGALIHHGRAGLLVAPGDPRALSRAMIRLWANAGLRSRLGAAARKSAAAQTWARRARGYDAVLKEALRERP